MSNKASPTREPLKSERKQSLPDPYISARAEATGFTILGTPEELATLLSKQIGDQVAERIHSEDGKRLLRHHIRNWRPKTS